MGEISQPGVRHLFKAVFFRDARALDLPPGVLPSQSTVTSARFEGEKQGVELATLGGKATLVVTCCGEPAHLKRVSANRYTTEKKINV